MKVEPDDFARAERPVAAAAQRLIASGIPADVVADALMANALAAWAAESSQSATARRLLHLWHLLREATHG